MQVSEVKDKARSLAYRRWLASLAEPIVHRAPEVPSRPDRLTFVSAMFDYAEMAILSAKKRPDGPRRGPRVNVSQKTRHLIYQRDGFQCRWCQSITDATALHLDHIQPWSADGSDFSENLRTLCEDCNTRRSNRFTDASYVTALPVTAECLHCALEREAMTLSEYVEERGPGQRISAFCGQCGITSIVPDWSWCK